MPEIQHIQGFDKEAVRTLNDLIDLVNLGLKDENIKSLSAAKLKRVVMERVTVGTTARAFKHGLGATPVDVVFDMRTSGRIYSYKDPDEENLYLKADSGTQTARIIVKE